MRYHVFASDYDGTLADQGRVGEAILQKLRQLKATERKLVLVTGREMKDLSEAFPDYKLFDFIVAENGAVLHETATGREQYLGPPPDPLFVQALREKGVQPISVGKVIVATWEPHEQEVLEVIKASGIERQVIFNKGAVMVLPPGVNKATGLHELLHTLHLSLHNTVAIGDAENDGALLQAAECAVAVQNALPALKNSADWVTGAAHGHGVTELVERLIENDLAELGGQLRRHYLELGKLKDGTTFSITPYRTGILLSGVSGSGKTTFTVSIIEGLIRKGYQFCLIDPEGDYLQLPGAVMIGNETSIPPLEEIRDLLRDPAQNLVICTLSIPLADRPIFFGGLLSLLLDLRRQYGRPHWILLDEAHHLVPAPVGTHRKIPADFNNFIIISTSPEALSAETLSKIGMVITIGKNPSYPIEQFCKTLGRPLPGGIPVLAEDEICVWECDTQRPPYTAHIHLPDQLQQRHKKKYAQGNMGYNSFFFTGPDNKLRLKATNLLLFTLMAEGVDTDTWLFHLHRKDYTRWFRHSVHDEELAKIGEEAERMADPEASKRHIVAYITRKYTT